MCYEFTNPFNGVANIWNFGDGTGTSSTELTVTHCYTDVDTYHNINATAFVTVQGSGQIPKSETLVHSNCQHGVFIGAVNGTSTTSLSSYSVMSNDDFNGSDNNYNVYVYAPIAIDKNFTFSETNIFMRPMAQFYLSQPVTFSLEDETFVGVTPTCECRWKGIIASSGILQTSGNTTIKDATYGIHCRTGVMLVDVQETNFVDNYIGVLAENFSAPAFNLNFRFYGNHIYSSGTLLDYCGVGSPYIYSQYGFDDSRTFAGIYFDKVHTRSIGSSGESLNTFEDLANGIVLVNSNVGFMQSSTAIARGIANCRFVNIQRGTYPPTIGGYGIDFKASEQGHFMKQEGTGLNNTTLPSFEACEVGISARFPVQGYDTKIISYNNRMVNMETGYRILNPYGTVRAEIFSNYISSDEYYGNGTSFFNPAAYCILADFGTQTSATQLKIHDNILSSDQDLTVTAGMRITKNFMDVSTEGIIDISENQISVLDKGAAIFAQLLGGALIQGNIIDVSDNNLARGIYLTSGVDNNVLCNDVDGPQGVSNPSISLPAQSGILALLTANPIIRDNLITDFDKALEVEFDCGTADIACNTFAGNNAYAIYYKADAMTGNQLDKGNIFDCASSGFEAYSLAYQISLEIFKAETGTDAYPDTHWPNEFFEPSNNPTPDCPTDSNCELTVVVAQLTPTDTAVADGQLTEFPGMINSAQQNLYRKLMDNPDLVTGNAIMTTFKADVEDGPVGQFYLLRKRIPELAKVPDTLQTQLDDNLGQIQVNLAAMDTLFYPLIGQTYWPSHDSLKLVYDSLATVVGNLYEENDSILIILFANRLLLADSLTDLNDSIDAVEVYDLNQQKVFDIFLNTLAIGDTSATIAQLDTLEAIAAQCPDEGGVAVLDAINLLRVFTGSNLEINECAEERSKKGLASSTQAKFGLYPNPTTGTCSLNYLLENGQTGILTVWDTYGKQVASYVLDSKSNKIQLDDLASGMFFVRLSVEDKILDTQKLIKF